MKALTNSLFLSAFSNTAAGAKTDAASKPAAAATAANAAGARVLPTLTAVSKAVPMPVRTTNRGSKTAYPFDDLTEVGMSFGVLNKTLSQMTSIVANANRKGVQTKKNPDGSTVFKMTDAKDASGAVIGQVPTDVAETEVVKKFFVVECDAKTDPDKAPLRIFREI